MMRNSLLALLSVFGFLLSAGLAQAYTESPTGVTFTVAYTEPTANVAGGPPNLTQTTIYYKLNAGAESSLVVPASAPAGGGAVSRLVTLPILPGQVGTISAQATATNSAGQSARTPIVTKTADRSGQAVDMPPTGLTVN